MKLIDRTIRLTSKMDKVEICPLGDNHLGCRSCAESLLKKGVKKIEKGPLSFWVGGGDYFDAIKPQDLKRFDMDIFPDWMLAGDAKTTRKKLNNILKQQFVRGCEIFDPIKKKCLGLIEGNHEYSVRKYHNIDIHQDFCDAMGAENLTDEAILRLRFIYKGVSQVVKIYICHGHGGGRTVAAEATHLYRMLVEWEDCDICLRGHSHTFHIIPPKSVLYLPNRGTLPPECLAKYRWAANWGCWVLSHKVGPSSYASRDQYPARPMMTCKVVIQPFARKFMNNKDYTVPEIEMRAITL